MIDGTGFNTVTLNKSLLLKVSVYMPSLKVVKNVIERMKNVSSFLVSGLMQSIYMYFRGFYHDGNQKIK